MPRTPSRKVLGLMFITLLLPCIYVHQEGYRSQIPASRLDLLHSLVVRHTFQIDAYHENTSNKAAHDGHYFSDKAPGVVVAALPAFSIAAGLLHFLDIPLDSDLGWLVSSWIACAGSIAIITALGGMGLFIWLCKWVQPSHAYLATLAVFLGATPLPYSTLLMSHGFIVGLFGIALWAGDGRINCEKRAGSQLLNLRDVIAGCCCGFALASEYSAGLAAAGILLYLVWSKPDRIFALLLGVIPPLMLIPAYHWICFGDPFTLAYRHEAVFIKMHEGFFGIHFPPKAENAFYLLLGSQQGLFFWSPVLLIAFVGYVQLYQISRVLFWIMYLVPVLQIVAIAGYFFPGAGGTLGPRLLAPVLPLMILPTALGIVRFPRVGCLLAFVSITITVLATIVDIVLPYGRNRLLDYYLPSLLEGKLSYNIGLAIGLPPSASLIPLAIGLGLGIWLSKRCLTIGRSSG